MWATSLYFAVSGYPIFQNSTSVKSGSVLTGRFNFQLSYWTEKLHFYVSANCVCANLIVPEPVRHSMSSVLAPVSQTAKTHQECGGDIMKYAGDLCL